MSRQAEHHQAQRGIVIGGEVADRSTGRKAFLPQPVASRPGHTAIRVGKGQRNRGAREGAENALRLPGSALPFNARSTARSHHAVNKKTRMRYGQTLIFLRIRFEPSGVLRKLRQPCPGRRPMIDTASLLASTWDDDRSSHPTRLIVGLRHALHHFRDRISYLSRGRVSIEHGRVNPPA